MIYDQPEHFGLFEKTFTAKEKEEVKQFLKYDRHVPLKLTEQVFHAEADASRFERLGQVGGAVYSFSFFFFPIIKGLPIKQRLFWAAVPGGIVAWLGWRIKEELEWNRVYNCYQKYQVAHSMHKKVFI
ncbi:unnamed protein product (macronuclear) [Paramecium tetraurelia]|uniref:Chromosome undetermined scaffold_12, whole genome shotgun sequence n=2 Tax=Paramecium TaxID=5884 RepID=A0BPV6_PARTE|nr:uncharacterized protein GSPATT00005323001 [Paramecium tetraurelia]XP_001440104.1 uncharacterized protein GSPATT00009099001 [Paramecium tetraurelia]XP_001459821.1 uncharacterized protein GSPATT00025158001 [Paramecium tetraurelia]CAD8136343.1 unnamed protein product [Paramecium octaurelia]CAD8142751.1 unnamed protein product [Paramecium octaurelia]CAK60573.1 unnamed protein product [Paramecium tetraurelia]CAK72707.1 unnamed protein product [Paramecium tetraurelia]CAK92424.1 unnamed protein |eukprot:XP_001427971.1 hypothetical protein (macronuclear) [Paramecium tetraurelia strain d4-2]